MKKLIWLSMMAVSLVLVAFLGMGCSSASTTTTNTEPVTTDTGGTLPAATDGQDAGAGQADFEVDIVNFEFQPAEVTVPLGTKVIWRNSDSVDHTATSDDGSFDSGTMAKGETYSFVFEKTGVYTYFCKIHPYMKGTITVK